MSISEQDWKLFKTKLADWQENYMEKLNKDYIELLSQNKPASEKFWELEKRIFNDRKNPGVILQLRRSTVYYDIANLINTDAIGYKNLDGFSEDLISAVKCINGD